jgi:uncharacterized membrane protein (DUF485 family)
MKPGRRWLGPSLFAAYTAAYAVFVGVAAFGTFRGGTAEAGLAREAFGGVAWGVVAGFGLIAGAFVLAVIYAVFGPPSEETAP